MTDIILLDSLDEMAMQKISPEGLPWKSEIKRGAVVTIGNFDGVHRGHVSLIQRVRQLASDASCPAVVVSFDPHPATLLRGRNAPMRLMSMERRAEVMKEYGIAQLLVCPVTPDFLQLSASQFFHSLVVDCLSASAMIEGPNFFFGRNREGDQAKLSKLCQQNRIGLEIISPTEDDDSMVSSSRVRENLILGEIETANALLSHPHQIRGTVIAGASRGRELGFPTANLNQVDVLAPAGGVYGGTASVGGELYHAAIHVGPNPTFDDRAERKIEVHLLDYQGDLYGVEMKVDFLTRLRDVARFASQNQLIEQLNRDIIAVRNYFETKSVR